MKMSWARASGLLVLMSVGCLIAHGRTPGSERPFVEIPFDFAHGEIVVQATVNGKGPWSMLLDTGVDPSVIELKTAKEIGLQLAAEGGPGSGGGTGANLGYPTILPVVRLGDLQATHLEAVGMDLSKISGKLGRPIAGVLGYSLLKARIVQIDYPRRLVRFYQVSPVGVGPSSTSRETTLPFQYQTEIIATGVRVNGKPVKANIDTGSNSLFQLTPAAVDKLGLTEEVARAHESSSVGFNGDLKNREGTVRNVSVGTISVNESSVVFFGRKMGLDDEAWDLRVGNKFLMGFVVTFNFQTNKITLTSP